MRFDESYKFSNALRIDSFNGKQDFLMGSLSSDPPIDAVYLGKVSEFDGAMGRDVWLDTKAAHVVYVIGKRRSGKSYSLGTIVEGLVSKKLKEGQLSQSALILDTLNIYWTMGKMPAPGDKQFDELSKWGISPEGVSPLTCYYPRGYQPAYSDPSYKEFAIKPSDLDAADWAHLFEVDPIVDPTGQLIAEVYDKVVTEGYSTGSSEIPSKGDYEVSDMIRCIDNAREVQRFPLQVREAARRRFKSVERLPVFSAAGTDVRDLFKAGQVTVLLLRDLDAALRGVIIGILVKKIMSLRGRTDELERRLALKLKETSSESDSEILQLRKLISEGLPRGWILIDEAHNYVPQGAIMGSKEPLKRYVNEGRNSGLSIAVTTQQPSGLDSAIRRNADVLLVHKITMQADLDVVASMLNTSLPEMVEISGQEVKGRNFDTMVRELPLGFAIVSCTNANRVFMIKIRPRTSVHGGLEY